MVENESLPLSRKCCKRRGDRFREAASYLLSIHSCSINRVLAEGCFGTNEAILRAKDYLLKENLLAWKDICTLVKVKSTRELNGVQSNDVRYLISDENVDKARYYNSLVRDHWSVENSLRWHLDVTFKEDASRARTVHAPQNLSVIRKFALQLVAKQMDKLSLKKRLYKTA